MENKIDDLPEDAIVYIKKFGLEYYKDGGYFCRTFVDNLECIHPISKEIRPCSKACYYLLTKGVNYLHKVRTSQVLHFYDGEDISVWMIDEKKKEMKEIVMGRKAKNFQVSINANLYYGLEVKKGFSLIGAQSAPGFDPSDVSGKFDREYLISICPDWEKEIVRLTKDH